ncbi:MAG: PilZ domain-containing protein [Deltaproteobacteria bacterium]|jgi:hypothetical protein|nr:PilZ domain-containing protein [Deltaproteobacteria bacterium]
MATSLLLSEKRRLLRRELIYYLKVNELLNNFELGRLVDIHTNGLLLIGKEPLELQKDYLIRIDLPVALADQGLDPIGIRAKCVWVRPSLAKPFMESGLMFLETSEEAKKTISLLINLFALPDVNPKA